MSNIEFKQYIGQNVQVSLSEKGTVITATLKGVNDYGVFLGDSKAPALTFAIRFYPWAEVGYIDATLVTGQTQAA